MSNDLRTRIIAALDEAPPRSHEGRADRIMAEVQTEYAKVVPAGMFDEAIRQRDYYMDSANRRATTIQALQAENERLKKQLAGREIVLDRMADVIARPSMEIRADLVALQDKCKKLAEKWALEQSIHGRSYSDELLETFGLDRLSRS